MNITKGTVRLEYLISTILHPLCRQVHHTSFNKNIKMQRNIIMGRSSHNAVINSIILSYIFHHVPTHTPPPHHEHTSHECNNENLNCHKIVIWI